MNRVRDVLVVGAGMSGLAAARDLQDKGLDVLAVDKGRGLGGRLAGRRFGGAVFDNGAQYVTARTPRFSKLLEGWEQAGSVCRWDVKPRDDDDDTIRRRGIPAMTALAKEMAQGLEVIQSVTVTGLQLDGDAWACGVADGESLRARAVVLTLPVPQALDLLPANEGWVSPDVRSRLEAIRYHRCFSVMAVLDGPSNLPQTGGLAFDQGPISWMADNRTKGISERTAVTLHASAEYSLSRWEEDRQVTAQKLLEFAAPLLGSPVNEFQIHGWKYSLPIEVQDEDCLILHDAPNLVLAGDAFGGGRVEGAVTSGWAAAGVLT